MDPLGRRAARCAGHSSLGDLHLPHLRFPFSWTLFFTDPRKTPLHRPLSGEAGAIVLRLSSLGAACSPRGRPLLTQRHREPLGRRPLQMQASGPAASSGPSGPCAGCGPSHLLCGSPERPPIPHALPSFPHVGTGEASCVWLFSWVRCPDSSLIVKYVFTFQPSNLTDNLYKNRELKSFREIDRWCLRVSVAQLTAAGLAPASAKCPAVDSWQGHVNKGCVEWAAGALGQVPATAQTKRWPWCRNVQPPPSPPHRRAAAAGPA